MDEQSLSTQDGADSNVTLTIGKLLGEAWGCDGGSKSDSFESKNGNTRLSKDGNDSNSMDSGKSSNGPISASTQARIEATIEDMFKQFKKKSTKKSKVKVKDTNPEDYDDNGGDVYKKNDKDADSDNYEDDESNTDSIAKKKRRYTKKKAINNLQMDERSLSTQDSVDSNSTILTTVKLCGDVCGENESQSMIVSDTTESLNQQTGPAKRGRKRLPKNETDDNLPTPARTNGGARRKSALAKLMKTTKRKKRKKTSSGEEDAEDDDGSDDFELQLPKTALKKDAQSSNGVSKEVEDILAQQLSDEATAKLLQANENRRSARATASKRTKYDDEVSELKDEDLLMPLTEAELAAEAAEEATMGDSTIMMTSKDNLVVDKILGIRLTKRKTKRKKQKQENKVKSESPKDKQNNEEKMELDKVSDPTSENKSESIGVDSSFRKIEDEPDKQNNDEEVKVEESKPKTESGQSDIENIQPKDSLEKDANLDDKPNTEEKIQQEQKDHEKDEEEEEEEESEWEEDGGEFEVEEFFVKYKNLSYLHCDWKTRDELFDSDKRIDQKIKRFRLKKSQQASMTGDWDEVDANGYNNDYDELFNPDYVEVDRILDSYDMEDPSKPKGSEPLRYYLVKWKALPYDEASWELEQDVKNKKKIERYNTINTLIPEIHMKHVARPKPDKWNQMAESRAYKDGNKLREYQLEGINWLTFCWLNARNCILADEMGLGKTVQSITFLQEIAFYGIKGPFLVIVPLSTIGNWIREFERWTEFNVIVYHGSSASRQMLQDYEFYFKESSLIAANVPTTGANKKNIIKFNALITTYEALLSDVQLFCQFKWRSVIIDEAHRLKNKNCKLMEGLKYMDVEHKVLLTGTPLQNNVEELFSLLHFLEPQQFNSSVEFMQEFGDLKTDSQVTKLQAVLKPMMLRRLKEDVEKNLAPKEETIVEVELTNTQKKYYRAILEKNFQFLTRGASSSNVPNLMNTMMELRKCCNHPYLINGAEDQIIDEFIEKNKNQSQPVNQDKLILQALVQASGKLVLCDKLLPKLKAGGHKVLIFSQMIRVLDIIEDYLIQMRFTYERIDGRIRGEARQEAIDRYSKPDSDRFAFLLCTRAGGVGINLTAADTVIIYDSDWNPQNDLQAQARCHRIGQRKAVKIYRLITRNTYEREMFDKASLKLGLDKAVLQSMRNEDKFNQQPGGNGLQLSKKEIEDLLKKGAYGAIMEDDNAGDKFCEEDIDKILQQRSTVIQIEGGEKGSTFSKASFQTSETNDISIDDPEFWQKWAKKADIDIEEKLNPKDERIIYEPRRRTQTRRYGGPDDPAEESDYSDSSDTDEANKGMNGKEAGKDGKKNRVKKSKRGGQGNDDDPAYDDDGDSNVWSREECYKVEKNLLIFGWSRWAKILQNCEFSSRKRVQTEQDVESLSRTIIAYTLKNYHGDETIKQFIIELIDPSKSNFVDLKNHQGLAAPVARGRKTKQPNSNNETETTESSGEKTDGLEWAQNAEQLLGDENYKKHLIRQANRILLRIRMLFYIKHEIIGIETANKIDEEDPTSESCLSVQDIDLQLPEVQTDLPAEWWDKQCDVSMVIGVYKHGYEKYSKMRSDTKLCFLQLCGPPNANDLLAEQQQQENENNDENNDGLDGEENDVKPKTSQNTKSKSNNKEKYTEESSGDAQKYQKFPSVSELNNRLRRLITFVQKYKKQEILMSKRNAERQEKLLSKLASTQEKVVARQMEKQSKWSRREEQNFYKAISSFGVDCIDKTNNIYAWERFKEIGQLDKKLDETLTDYFNSFYYMCKKVCHKLADDEQQPVNEVQVETISEERASRCIQRVELLNKVRHDVLKHEKFEEWISECCMPSADLPDWWIPCKHDKDLIKAASRYGVIRTEHYYINDQELSFKKYLTKYMRHIEDLMNEDNSNLEPDSPNLNTDPIQYYFHNQSKIQITFKAILNKEKVKKTVKGEDFNSKDKIEIKQEIENEPLEQNDSYLDESKMVIDESVNNLSLKKEDSEEKNKGDQVNGAKDEEDEKEITAEDETKSNIHKKTDQVKHKTEEFRRSRKSSSTTEKDVKKEEEKSIGEDDQSLTYFGNNAVPMIMWPKDRVIINRLENIINMFENGGEWPQRTLFPYAQAIPGQKSNTQIDPTTQLTSNLLSISNLTNSSNMLSSHQALLAEQRKLMISPMLTTGSNNGSTDGHDDYDYENYNNDEYDNFNNKNTNVDKSKYQKQKRGRPIKFDLPQMAHSAGISLTSSTGIPADPSNKIKNLLNTINGEMVTSKSKSKSQNSDDQDSDYIEQKSPYKAGEFLEPGEIVQAKPNRTTQATPNTRQGQQIDLENNDPSLLSSFSNGKQNPNKRGRKSLPVKEPSASMPSSNPMLQIPGANFEAAQALAYFIMNNGDPDEKIPVFNVENGSRVVGSKAPKRSELSTWLISHPNYFPEIDPDAYNLLLNNLLSAMPNDMPDMATVSQPDKNQKRTTKSLKQSHPSTPHDYLDDESIDEEEDDLEIGEKPPTPKPAQSKSNHTSQPTNNNINNNYNNNSNNSNHRSSRSSSQTPQSNKSSKQPVDQTRKIPNDIPKQQPNEVSSNSAPIVLFNKITNKKLNSTQVPSWNSLSAFLAKNQQIFIDPSSNEVIRNRYGRGGIPDLIKSRMIHSSSANNNNKPMPHQSNNKTPQQSSNVQKSQPVASPATTSQSSRRSSINPSQINNINSLSSNNNNKKTNRSSSQSNIQAQQQQLLNPFSSDSTANQLQGFNELLGAAGSFDFNSQLTGIMAAALAAQGEANPALSFPFGNITPGALDPFLLSSQLGAMASNPFSPFLMPSLAGLTLPGVSVPPSNPFNPLLAGFLKDLNEKSGTGSLEDFAASLAAQQHQQDLSAQPLNLSGVKSYQEPSSSRNQRDNSNNMTNKSSNQNSNKLNQRKRTK